MLEIINDPLLSLLLLTSSLLLLFPVLSHNSVDNIGELGNKSEVLVIVAEVIDIASVLSLTVTLITQSDNDDEGDDINS
uniref:Secreted protein n=1 Tax=Schistosoma curassoni TaxID=6186 RepID=A0A183KS02_9TREM